MADRLWPRSHYTSSAGARRACAAAVLRFDSRRTGGSADRGVGTHQRHPQPQQLAATDSELAGLRPARSGRTDNATVVDDADIGDVSLKLLRNYRTCIAHRKVDRGHG